ncbi:hypothetical protein BAUCODRAFT_28617 [Baudoinia panamericana UAMH 10762]|uniref:Transmembrane protein n=1 Tax=Baudoinia panamericana (strain UAMH 10762) TaxID=717646 RepID=M2M2Z1_BAUPA|nr:uncharacterized protein BAUCODRAFT_28617 [Baudoinia panamericana UAMH 10762]EMC90901.1 hypothetical protein BAUCODRAFT_28617 [Baudoinia panamericana UAMH 10762]
MGSKRAPAIDIHFSHLLFPLLINIKRPPSVMSRASITSKASHRTKRGFDRRLKSQSHDHTTGKAAAKQRQASHSTKHSRDATEESRHHGPKHGEESEAGEDGRCIPLRSGERSKEVDRAAVGHAAWTGASLVGKGAVLAGKGALWAGGKTRKTTSATPSGIFIWPGFNNDFICSTRFTRPDTASSSSSDGIASTPNELYPQILRPAKECRQAECEQDLDQELEPPTTRDYEGPEQSQQRDWRGSSRDSLPAGQYWDSIAGRKGVEERATPAEKASSVPTEKVNNRNDAVAVRRSNDILGRFLEPTESNQSQHPKPLSATLASLEAALDNIDIHPSRPAPAGHHSHRTYLAIIFAIVLLLSSPIIAASLYYMVHPDFLHYVAAPPEDHHNPLRVLKTDQTRIRELATQLDDPND